MADLKIVGGTEGFERNFRDRRKCEKGHRERDCLILATRVKLR